MPLVDASDSVLVVIDVQEGFLARDLGAADRERAGQALARLVWLARLARKLEIPAVLTEEDPERNGPTEPGLREALDGAPVFAKPTFGLAATPEILAAVEATGRRTAVLVGMETDVCVAQSAIGLLDRGLRVVVLEDATFSPGEMHDRGLSRVAAQGVEINHTKGVAYEWVGTVEASRRIIDADPQLSTAPFRL